MTSFEITKKYMSFKTSEKQRTQALNDDLSRIYEWAHRWKMLFNPDITKQAQEVIFSRKNSKNDLLIVYFNKPLVAHTTCLKHLGMCLDEKLSFNHHVKEIIGKANKGIGLIHKLAHVLPRQSLLTIYISFIRPHLDYGDIIYVAAKSQKGALKWSA